MKRSLCAALACAFIFISAAVPTQKASAYAVYGRVIEYDVGFYKDPQCTSLLFYLPYSYYVEIAEKGETISRAELFSGSYETPAIDGYVYTSELYFDDETPENPASAETSLPAPQMHRRRWPARLAFVLGVVALAGLAAALRVTDGDLTALPSLVQSMMEGSQLPAHSGAALI